MLLIDRIEATDPVRVHSHFVLNNRDNALGVNVATDTKLVLRRGSAAVKFFQLAAIPQPGPLRRSWGHLHDVYHPEPNQLGQSREGASHIYTFVSDKPRTTHLAIYGIVADAEPNIRGWHLNGTLDTGFVIDYRGETYLQLDLSDPGNPILSGPHLNDAPGRRDSFPSFS